MNRQQRRALERGRNRPDQMAGFTFQVTPDEAAILEEALAWWLHQTRLDLPDQPDQRQRWALARGERLRQAFDAAISDRPWKDVAPQREAPLTEGM